MRQFQTRLEKLENWKMNSTFVPPMIFTFDPRTETQEEFENRVSKAKESIPEEGQAIIIKVRKKYKESDEKDK
ncbi:hypothetical protein [Atribacter laminatus]|uniref:Uncharacterized protein n=1 Tax=Atribacter laminatus TaxID=2847778 RepID=A0A7T1AMX4_ATRLM|nr:hypothetical protein [Atribacter laminatus]QPM68869.1 hypothetical protein RT761_02096 [Atribacter laminatus]